MATKRSARQPRQWAIDPERFGTRRDIEWHEPADSYDEVCLAAAKTQHQIVARLDAYRRSIEGMTWLELADEFHMGYDQLTKVRRGQAHLSLRHIADFERLKGTLVQVARQHLGG